MPSKRNSTSSRSTSSAPRGQQEGGLRKGTPRQAPRGRPRARPADAATASSVASAHKVRAPSFFVSSFFFFVPLIGRGMCVAGMPPPPHPPPPLTSTLRMFVFPVVPRDDGGVVFLTDEAHTRPRLPRLPARSTTAWRSQVCCARQRLLGGPHPAPGHPRLLLHYR